MQSSRNLFRWGSPVKLAPALLGAWIGLGLASPSQGGPNQGGILLLHWNQSLVYSTGLNYCGQSGLVDCGSAITRADTQATIVLHTLAAFPHSGSPRLAGTTFALHYDGTQISVVDWHTCGDFELSNEGWPASDTGTAITWSTAQTGYVTEVAWFAATSYYASPETITLIPHTTCSGASFADDAVPSNIDPIAGLGSFGFYRDGSVPCPPSDVPIEAGLSSYTFDPPRPNPVSSTTEFTFSLPPSGGAGASTQLDIFSASGRREIRLLDEVLEPGKHGVVWNARGELGRTLPAGTYFGRLTSGGKVLTKQIQLLGSTASR